MCDDQRQGIFMFRPNMDEVDVQPVDLSDKLRHRIELRLDLPPVVVRLPIVHELLQDGQRHALRFIRDGLLVGPPCGRQAAAKVDEVLVGNIDAERTDRNGRGCQRRRPRKEARRAHRCNSRRSGAQELASVLMYNFGTHHEFAPGNFELRCAANPRQLVDDIAVEAGTSTRTPEASLTCCRNWLRAMRSSTRATDLSLLHLTRDTQLCASQAVGNASADNSGCGSQA